MAGFDADGEVYTNRCLQVGVVSGTAVRDGKDGRCGEGVTSIRRIVLNIALACSELSVSYMHAYMCSRTVPLSASDSEGITLFLDGVDGPLLTIEW